MPSPRGVCYVAKRIVRTNFKGFLMNISQVQAPGSRSRDGINSRHEDKSYERKRDVPEEW